MTVSAPGISLSSYVANATGVIATISLTPHVDLNQTDSVRVDWPAGFSLFGVGLGSGQCEVAGVCYDPDPANPNTLLVTIGGFITESFCYQVVTTLQNLELDLYNFGSVLLVAAGTPITLQVAGLTNPPAGTYSTGDIYTNLEGGVGIGSPIVITEGPAPTEQTIVNINATVNGTQAMTASVGGSNALAATVGGSQTYTATVNGA